MTIGIDRLSFSTTAYALPLEELARAQGIDPGKYEKGLGQKMMSVPTPREDQITLGIDAALPILQERPELLDKIDLFLWATESATDQAKAAAVIAHRLLGLKESCRAMELKQACYSGAFALRTAINFLKSGDSTCALVIASDIARYQRHTPAESSQGAAAVAMLICHNPDLLELASGSAFMTLEARDFYRPTGCTEPIVDGKYSCTLYLKMLEKLAARTSEPIEELAAFCCHTPLPRLAEKAAEQLALPHFDRQKREGSLRYARLIGNSYTAALFINLCSLLENTDISSQSTPQKILCYSYGSGATAEIFYLNVQPQSARYLYKDRHTHLLDKRQICSMSEYALWHEQNSQTVVAGPVVPGRVFKSGIEKGHVCYRLPMPQTHDKEALHGQKLEQLCSW